MTPLLMGPLSLPLGHAVELSQGVRCRGGLRGGLVLRLRLLRRVRRQQQVLPLLRAVVQPLGGWARGVLVRRAQLLRQPLLLQAEERQGRRLLAVAQHLGHLLQRPLQPLGGGPLRGDLQGGLVLRRQCLVETSSGNGVGTQ